MCSVHRASSQASCTTSSQEWGGAVRSNLVSVWENWINSPQSIRQCIVRTLLRYAENCAPGSWPGAQTVWWREWRGELWHPRQGGRHTLMQHTFGINPKLTTRKNHKPVCLHFFQARSGRELVSTKCLWFILIDNFPDQPGKMLTC